MFDTNTLNADLAEWRMTGETDLTGLDRPLKEAIIREYFEDAPWIITFALDMQGVYYVDDLDDIEREATDSYQGEWIDATDYAASVIEDAYGDVLEALPGFLRYNIDYAAIGHDMELGGEINTYDTGNCSVYVFNTTW